jgi:hypothetical protein
MSRGFENKMKFERKILFGHALLNGYNKGAVNPKGLAAP